MPRLSHAGRALDGLRSRAATRATAAARRAGAHWGVDVATGLGTRERLLADLRHGGSRRRRLELVSVRRGDGRHSPGAVVAVEPLLRVMASAAVAHHATAYHLGESLFAFVGPADGAPGALAATVRAAAAGLGDPTAEPVHGETLVPDEATDPASALQLALDRLHARARLQHRSAERQIRDVLLQALAERRTGVTGVAMTHVAAHAVAVGRRMGLDIADLDVLVRAAELQDIGKLAIPDSILGKRGPLTEAEWEVVRRHPVIGERIVRAASALAPVAELVRSCSERFDGSGYPDGLRGDDIPLGSRIIAVCVAFDAMTSPRPYRPARPAAQALEELYRCGGFQFDPIVVAAFGTTIGDRRGPGALSAEMTAEARKAREVCARTDAPRPDGWQHPTGDAGAAQAASRDNRLTGRA